MAVVHALSRRHDHINTITKYVVATQPVNTTLWNPTVVIPEATLINDLMQLKQTEGSDILIWCIGQLTDALAAAGLLDEYRICTSTVIKGTGEPLFRPASAGTVELLDTKTFTSGAVIHAYPHSKPNTHGHRITTLDGSSQSPTGPRERQQTGAGPDLPKNGIRNRLLAGSLTGTNRNPFPNFLRASSCSSASIQSWRRRRTARP
jgi:RibD C-terminal domain